MSEAIIFHCDVEICGSKIKKGTFVRQKEWIGLTEDEVSEIIDREIGFNSCWGPEHSFARAIEAKLKEKNHG